MSRRILAVLLAVLVAAIVLFATRDSSSEISVTQTLRTVDLVASVNAINVDSGWSQENGVTRGGAMRLSLDDLRVLTVQEGTLAAEYGSTSACTDFVKPNACVLLADMLGDAVVWFALVPSDVLAGREFLTLPGLVDMQANGDEGVLRNGWVRFNYNDAHFKIDIHVQPVWINIISRFHIEMLHPEELVRDMSGAIFYIITIDTKWFKKPFMLSNSDAAVSTVRLVWYLVTYLCACSSQPQSLQ